MDYMKHRIALLADVHGNVSALKAVVEDCINEGVTDYWFLGDLIMPVFYKRVIKIVHK